MSQTDADDPRCPECGEPIGATATYCMHCSADLTEEREQADADGDGYWDSGRATAGDASRVDDGRLLDPDGLADDTLTAVVGLGGGLVVGAIGTVVLSILTGSAWGFALGILAWLAATVYLVGRPTVWAAVSKTAYGVAIVLLLVPLIAFGPSDGGTDLATRAVVFAVMLGGLVVPAAIVAGVGFAVSKLAPEAGDAE